MRQINRAFYKLNQLDIREIYDELYNDYYDYYTPSTMYNNSSEYDKHYYDNYNYGYHEPPEYGLNVHLLPGRSYINNGRLSKFYFYNHIDLATIYSKSELRDRRLNDLLGLPNGTHIIKKTLLEDLIKNDKSNT